MGLSRGNYDLVKVFTGKTLAAGSLTPVNEGFPMGEAWARMLLVFHLAIVIGTGSGPVTEGELAIIKGITLRNSKGWNLFNNVPGRALYRLDQIKNGTMSPKTAIAAASATYDVYLYLNFIDKLMKRPEDTILDTSMFNKIQLEMNMGGLSDLFGTVGTATLAITLDCYIEKVRGRLPDNVKPRNYIEVGMPAPVNPANATDLNFERAENLAYKRLLVQAANSVTSGVGFSGTPADTTIASMGIDTDKGELFNKTLWPALNAIHKVDYEIEAALPGYAVFDFCKDRSIMSSVISGIYSRLRLIWDNGTLSTSQVSAIYDGLRKIQN